jgi:hypothetical protein
MSRHNGQEEPMQLIFKAAVSLLIIIFATWIGKKYPSLAGLVAVMPLIGLLVLVFLHIESRGDPVVMLRLPGRSFGSGSHRSFLCTVFICYKKDLPLPVVLGTSFAAWIAAALFINDSNKKGSSEKKVRELLCGTASQNL